MPFDQDERSSLWGLTAGTAFASGIGYSLYSNRNSIINAAGFGRGESLFSNVAGQMGRTSSFINRPSSIFQQSLVENSLSAMEDINLIKENVKSAAYESLMASRNITPNNAIGLISSINKQSSISDILGAATNMINSSGGDIGLFGKRITQQASDVGARLSFLGDAIKSGGNFRSSIVSNLSFSNLSPEAQSRFNSISKNILAASQNRFDINLKAIGIQDVIGGKSVLSENLMVEVGDRSFEIPLTMPGGFTYSGGTRYIPRKAYTNTGNILSYSNVVEQTFVEAIQRSQVQSQLKQNLFEAHHNLIQDMWDKDTAGRVAAIWSLPEPMLTSGGRATGRLISRQAVPFNVQEDEMLSLLGEKNLYPFTSPNAAGKGTLFTSNIATDLFGPLGNFISAEQRPTQFVRSEWGPTELAKKRAEDFGGIFGLYYNRVGRKNVGDSFSKLMYGNKSPLSGSAYSAPQLITFYARPGEGNGVGFAKDELNNILAAEEGVLNPSTRDMFEYERVIQKKISLNKGLNVNKQILEGLTGKSGLVQFQKPISGGAFIGIEKDTGRELALLHDEAVNQSIIGAEVSGIEEATVFVKEKRQLKENELWKFFSEENKFLLGTRKQKEFQSIARAAGLSDLSIAGQNIEAIQSGKLVGRNKMALLNQQIEATSMFLSNKIEKENLSMTREMGEFLDNPVRFLNVKEILEANKQDADYQIQKNLVGLARNKWGFSRRELGFTFGLASEDVLSKLVSEGALGEKEAYGISRSAGVVGIGKGMLGDLTQGYWGRGSFEQSGFRMLSMKGEEGLSYSAELYKRLLDKERIQSTDLMAESVLGQQGIVSSIKRTNVADLLDLTKFQAEGGYYNIGKNIKEFGGSSSLYIPGTSEFPELFKPVISGGKEISSPFVSNLNWFQNSLYAGDESQIEASAIALRNTVVRLSEEQAAARGKVIGSQILTGIRRTYAEEPDTFRISKQSASKMFEDLMEKSTSSSQKAFLEEQKNILFAGESVVGGMWRHPATGPESFQFIKYRLDKNLQEGLVGAPTKFATINLPGKSFKADVSEMVGFAGDFDRDQYVVSAIAEKATFDKVRRNIDTTMRQQYSEYVFNHYAMKDLVDGSVLKADKLAFGSQEALQEGFAKLTTAKTTTGQVNTALQKLKIGLQYSAPEKYRPLADLFFHLEQAAIGGKHGVLNSALYQGIASATQGGQKGRETMESVLSSIFGQQDINISGSITNAMGRQEKYNLSVNMKEMADVAISSYDAVSKDVDLAMKSASLAKGKGFDRLSLEDITAAFNARRSGSIDISQVLAESSSGRYNTVTTKTSRLLRQVGSKAKGMVNAAWKGKKYMLAGAGVAAAIGFMSPSISGVVHPSRMPNKDRRGTDIDDMGAAGGGLQMDPPSPGMNMSPRAYDFGETRQTTSANVRMGIDDFESNSSDFIKSTQSLGKSNVYVSDDRAILHPQSLANKICERL